MSLLDLPVEIVHRIFDNLDTKTIFCSVRCTCSQLYRIVNSYDRFEVNLSSVSKFNFEVVNDLIDPSNIISLILSFDKTKSDKIDSFFSIFKIGQFIRVRSLTLLNISHDELDRFYELITLLPLLSFSIELRDPYLDKSLTLLSKSIDKWNLLKLNLINVSYIINKLSWPIPCILTHLTIQYCSLNEYIFILEHSPHLRTFVMKNLTMFYADKTILISSTCPSYPQLTCLMINDCQLSFEDLDSLLSLTPSIIYLNLQGHHRCKFDSTFDGYHWEQIIQSKLKLLNHFKFIFKHTLIKSFKYPNIHHIINTFRTTFWIQNKQWFVNCDCIIKSSLTQLILYTIPTIHTNDFKILITCKSSNNNQICYFTNHSSHQTEDQQQRSVIDEINLEGNNKGPQDILFLSCALKHDTTLVKLNLAKNDIGADGTEYLSNALQDNKTLNTLNIGGNRIGEEGAQYLSDILRKNQTLTKLIIGGNHLGRKGILYLANVLEKNTTLTILDLQDNQIGDEGIKDLCIILQKNKTLMRLDLSSNQIESSGLQYLSDILGNNTSLITLNLRDNKILSEGVEYIAHALQTNMTLTSLNLRSNCIDDKGIEYLSNALTINKTLIRINLWNNRITGLGSRYLSQALQKNSILVELNLGRNQIGTMGTKHLSDMLRTNSTLLTLSLWENRIRDKGAEYLSIVLETNMTLSKLDIGSNHITDKGRELFSHLSSMNKTLIIINLENDPLIID